MNLFVLDSCPVQAAKYYCNVHCRKICTEAAQILCNPFILQGISAPYLLSNHNHPVCVWVRESKENFEWALAHFKALLTEYKRRYKREHACYNIYIWIKVHKNKLSFNESGLTPFAKAFGDYKKDLEHFDPVTGYRHYYLTKSSFTRWPSLSEIPDWWETNDLEYFVDKNFINGEYVKRN